MNPLELKGGWAYCSEQILQLIPDLIKEKEINIIEFGAGDSSVKIREHMSQIYGHRTIQ